MEVGCSTIEQFLQKMKIAELKTLIGLKGVRLVRKGEKLACVAYSDTIVEVKELFITTPLTYLYFIVDQSSNQAG
jgi:hypothetical protein